MDKLQVKMEDERVLIIIDETMSQYDIITALKCKIVEIRNIYQGSVKPMQITGKILKNVEMEEIQEIVKSFLNIQVDFDSPKELGIHGIKKSFSKTIDVSETKYYKGAIRSGTRVEFEGSVVVIGDVNSGAEVIAGENITILGELRGLAHAGAKGNRNAIIEAVTIDTKQIRIADIIKGIENRNDFKSFKSSVYIDESGNMVLE